MFGPDSEVAVDVPTSAGLGFVAVHVGSGCHSRTREKLYLEGKRSGSCVTAYQAAVRLTEASGVALFRACQTASGASDCMTGVTRAVKALEVNFFKKKQCVLSLVSCLASTAHLCTSMHMQEAEVTNAGLGSNLTLEGSVEADASIMLGNRTFAAVGAAPGLYVHSSLCSAYATR